MAGHGEHDEYHSGAEDWQSYRRYVLAALRDMKEEQLRRGRQSDEFEDEVRKDMTKMKIQVGIIAALGGGAMTIAVEVVSNFLKHA